MKQRILVVVLVLFSFYSYGQIRIGFLGGISNYQGDLTDKAYSNSNAAFGITGTFPVSQRFNIRAGLSFLKIGGADSLSQKPELKARNLSFQSKITELSLLGEYNIFNIEDTKWTPYIFAGLALFHFDPYTFDQAGVKNYLNPLSTEGQGLPGYPKHYNLTQMSIPFGMGVKYAITDKVQIGLEVGLRKTFTDYLDDVSTEYADPDVLLAGVGQKSVELSYRGGEVGFPDYPVKGFTRGNPKSKDYYYVTGLHLSFAIGDGSGGSDKKYGCPKVY